MSNILSQIHVIYMLHLHAIGYGMHSLCDIFYAISSGGVVDFCSLLFFQYIGVELFSNKVVIYWFLLI